MAKFLKQNCFNYISNHVYLPTVNNVSSQNSRQASFCHGGCAGWSTVFMVSLATPFPSNSLLNISLCPQDFGPSTGSVKRLSGGQILTVFAKGDHWGSVASTLLKLPPFSWQMVTNFQFPGDILTNISLIYEKYCMGKDLVPYTVWDWIGKKKRSFFKTK